MEGIPSESYIHTLQIDSNQDVKGSSSPRAHCPLVVKQFGQAMLESQEEEELSVELAREKKHDLEILLSEITAAASHRNCNPLEWPQLRALLLRAAKHLEEQAHLLLGLRSAALTDDLTGLYNRRGFLILSRQLLKLARRNGRAVLVFSCDVNQLKSINDLHGHAAGDACLVRCAAALKETFRKSDIVGRFGGDEFVVLALETAGDSETAILRRLREVIDRRNREGSDWALSLSVGTARSEGLDRTSLAELLITADQQMYEDKQTQLGASARASFFPAD